jgi:lysophospholipase L1-like esterase
VNVVHGQLPNTWIYFVSVMPTPLRWERQRRTNQLVEEFCGTKSNVRFLDVSTAILDSRGKPRRDLFKWDGLNPSAECYALWTSIVRPVLMEHFATHEPFGPAISSPRSSF